VGTTGLAWAFRREAFNACGGHRVNALTGAADQDRHERQWQ